MIMNLNMNILITIEFFRDVTGKFPEYPDEDEGGSALIFKNKSVTELENEMANMVINLLL
jgi:hypothetical protein